MVVVQDLEPAVDDAEIVHALPPPVRASRPVKRPLLQKRQYGVRLPAFNQAERARTARAMADCLMVRV